MTAISEIRLTEWTACGGCAAKWGAAPLDALVKELAGAADPSLLVGLAPFDDAAVYRLGPDQALVSTTDFFPPLVDDPADFGAIAAANACSDVFAMGGRVVLALNIAAFPERMPPEVIAAIFSRRGRGGRRAPAAWWPAATPSGRRSRSSAWPSRAWSTPTGCGPSPGRGPATCWCCPSRSAPASCWPAGRGRTRPRPSPRCGRSTGPRPRRCRASAGDGPHAVTDVTGFGLLGHGWEMARALRRRPRLRRRPGCRCTRGPWPRPRRAPAPAATPATGPTSKAGSPPRRPGRARGAGLRPADVGRPAGRGRARRRRRPGRRRLRRGRRGRRRRARRHPARMRRGRAMTGRSRRAR